MVDISNNGIISITRGDYAEFPLFINQGDKFYPIRYELLKDPSTKMIIFSVMTFNQNFEDAFIRKKYNRDSFTNEQNDLIIAIKPEDTINIPAGKYFYEVKYIAQYENGHFCQETLIPKRLFFIKD